MILVESGNRLAACVGLEDTVARLASDEFGIILSGSAQVDELNVIIRSIQESVNLPFDLEQRIQLTASIGAAIYPDDGMTANELVRNAVSALNAVKSAGVGGFRFFSSKITEQAASRLRMLNQLRGALEAGQFRLFYQPKVDLRTGAICGVEALARWMHPELGLVLPNNFIPLAEDSGLIMPIGEWVLQEAGVFSRKAAKAGQPVHISVNVSSIQFKNENIVDAVRDIVTEHWDNPGSLEIEVTESMLMEDVERNIGVMNDIKAMGVGLALDDFGTGYSSLSYLKRLPVDVLKIDRSFVADLPNDAESAAIVSTIVAMAKELRLRVVAEGPENEEHVAFLRKHKCDMAQGYFFSRPLPEAELLQLLNDPGYSDQCTEPDFDE